MLRGGGACFTLKPRVILVAELDLTVPPTCVCRGVSVHPVCYRKFSLCPGEAPLPPAEQRLEGRMPRLWSSPQRAAVSCLLLICSKARFLCLRLPFLLGALEPRPAWSVSCFPLGVEENQSTRRRALRRGFPGGAVGRSGLPVQEAWETQVRSVGQEDPLEEEVATRSTLVAWEIPWTESPAGLQSMGSQSQTRLSMHKRPLKNRSNEVVFRSPRPCLVCLGLGALNN